MLRAPDRLTTPSSAAPTASSRPAGWDDGPRPRGRAAPRIRGEHGADAVAVFGGGGLTNEKAYQLGQVRPGRARHREHRLQRALLHEQRRRRRQPLPRARPRPAVPARRPRRRAGRPPARQQPRRDDAAVGRAPRRRAGARAGSSSSTHGSARPPTLDRRRRRACTSSPCPAPTSSSCSACCTWSSPRAWPTRLPRRAHDRRRRTSRRLAAAWWPERAEQVAGVPADQLRASRGCSPPRARRAAVAGPTSSPGAGSSSPPRAPPPSTAAINLALALGLPGRVGSGYGALTGQGNGQGGREHGQKSDQLPGYRRIDDPAARAHVAAVWGVDPDAIPGKGKPAVELLDSLGRDGRSARAARPRRQPAGVSARTPVTSATGSTRSTCSSSATSSRPRPRSAPTSCCPSSSGPRRRAR